MSLKKPERPTQRTAPNPDQKSGNDNSTKRHGYMDRSFTADLINGLRDAIESSNKKQDTKKRKDAFWVKLGTIGTILATFFVGYQGCLLRESNRINRESLQSVQRAYVAFLRIDPTVDNRAKTIDFQSVFENTGTTPAIDAITTFTLAMRGAEPSEQDFQNTGTSNEYRTTVVAPKKPQQGGRVRLKESILFGSELNEKFTNFGKLHLTGDIYFWGWVVYRDIFKKTAPHLTEFCQHLDSVGINANGSPRLSWVYTECRQHNCTDTNCPDYNEIIKVSKFN